LRACDVGAENEERSTHTFTMDELSINARLALEETKRIEINPNKVGSYTLTIALRTGLKGWSGISR
jgi:hypothetical protein